MTTLAMILVIALVVALAQARANAGRLTFARLERVQSDALAELAVRERLRLILADAITGRTEGKSVSLDGTTFTMEGPDYYADIRLNDVSGLVDLYFSPAPSIGSLPGGRGLATARANQLARLAPGERFPVEEATLARFGVNRTARQAMEGLITQSSGPGGLNLAHVPAELRPSAEVGGMMDAKPVRSVQVRVKVRR